MEERRMEEEGIEEGEGRGVEWWRQEERKEEGRELKIPCF